MNGFLSKGVRSISLSPCDHHKNHIASVCGLKNTTANILAFIFKLMSLFDIIYKNYVIKFFRAFSRKLKTTSF